MSTYIATAWMPGYLPEDDDPAAFDDLGMAWSYVASVIEQDWDSEYETAETADERLEIDGRYLSAHTECALIRDVGTVWVDGPTSTHLGRTYGVLLAEEMPERMRDDE